MAATGLTLKHENDSRYSVYISQYYLSIADGSCRLRHTKDRPNWNIFLFYWNQLFFFACYSENKVFGNHHENLSKYELLIATEKSSALQLKIFFLLSDRKIHNSLPTTWENTSFHKFCSKFNNNFSIKLSVYKIFTAKHLCLSYILVYMYVQYITYINFFVNYRWPFL